mmetsp:Transcript_63988/g.152585  ORF Transcript_63988/g.152585 Transcript_63988/m.152585 type:complete len:563 (-) Transcript_63988:14-1702(-)
MEREQLSRSLHGGLAEEVPVTMEEILLKFAECAGSSEETVLAWSSGQVKLFVNEVFSMKGWPAVRSESFLRDLVQQYTLQRAAGSGDGLDLGRAEACLLAQSILQVVATSPGGGATSCEQASPQQRIGSAAAAAAVGNLEAGQAIFFNTGADDAWSEGRVVDRSPDGTLKVAYSFRGRERITTVFPDSVEEMVRSAELGAPGAVGFYGVEEEEQQQQQQRLEEVGLFQSQPPWSLGAPRAIVVEPVAAAQPEQVSRSVLLLEGEAGQQAEHSAHSARSHSRSPRLSAGPSRALTHACTQCSPLSANAPPTPALPQEVCSIACGTSVEQASRVGSKQTSAGDFGGALFQKQCRKLTREAKSIAVALEAGCLSQREDAAQAASLRGAAEKLRSTFEDASSSSSSSPSAAGSRPSRAQSAAAQVKLQKTAAKQRLAVLEDSLLQVSQALRIESQHAAQQASNMSRRLAQSRARSSSRGGGAAAARSSKEAPLLGTSVVSQSSIGGDFSQLRAGVSAGRQKLISSTLQCNDLSRSMSALQGRAAASLMLDMEAPAPELALRAVAVR